MTDQLHELKAACIAAMEADNRPAMIGLGDELLARDPANPLGLAAISAAMLREERFGIAGQLLGALSKMRPDDAQVWNNFACALQEYHPADALHCLEQAMRLGGEDFEEPIRNCVGVLSTLGRFRQAVEVGRDLLARSHSPTDPNINHNLALAELQVGDWRQAWPRWQYSEKRKERDYHAPHGLLIERWAGQASDELGPHKVVVYGEQGLGDEILAASQIDRAAYALNKAGGGVILECEPRLEGLFRRSFPRVKVYGTLLEDAPAWVAEEQPTHKLESMGLMELYAPEPFRQGAYLVPDLHYRRMFRGYLDSLGEGLKVGLAWTGGVKAWDRAQRCIPREVLAPLTSSPGCRFVSLEYQFDGPPPEGVVEIPWATAKGVDYDLTAALIAELDLVISVPQTCVDAAGAIGTPCWVLTPPVPQWRFSEAAGDEAWVYQGVDLIRRQGPFWQGAVAKAAQRLRIKAQAREISRRAAE